MKITCTENEQKAVADIFGASARCCFDWKYCKEFSENCDDCFDNNIEWSITVKNIERKCED